MNRLFFLLSLIGLAPLVANGSGLFYGYQSESARFGFEMTRKPDFPQELLSAGVMRGEALLLLHVDEGGKLADSLIIEATHQGFADAIDQVKDDWKYVPTVLDGTPSGIVMKLRVSFESGSGLVVVNQVGALPGSLASRIHGAGSIRIYSPQELDDFLLPVYQEPLSLVPYIEPGSPPVKFVMDFFVDRDGRVRMPHARYQDEPVRDELVIAAQESLRQWLFQPPRAKGKPVTVRAAQPFVFHPPAE